MLRGRERDRGSFTWGQTVRPCVWSDGSRRDALIVGAHGAYLKGWRNASPAFSPATGNTSTLEAPLSATTIWVSPGIAVPLERDRVTSIVACVEFHKHAWLLSGFGHLTVELGNGT